MTPLTFDQLRAANLSRCGRWHPGFPDDEEWTVADWSNAMAGEAGEACNKVKKLRRQETGYAKSLATREFLIEQIAEEIADTVLYADLLAAKLGIDLGAVVIRKFNEVSIREGYPERLSVEVVRVERGGE